VPTDSNSNSHGWHWRLGRPADALRLLLHGLAHSRLNACIIRFIELAAQFFGALLDEKPSNASAPWQFGRWQVH
jgi:hypothetical protein